MAVYFTDRQEAGKALAKELLHYRHAPQAIVLGLPRGGVPVAFEVARVLRLPLDMMLVRKLGLPGQEELAMGAIANGDVKVLSNIIHELGVSPREVESVLIAERKELERRTREYRQGHLPPSLEGKTVILVDDGLATGANMHAAVLAARKKKAARIIAAAPVASRNAAALLDEVADEVAFVDIPRHFGGVGQFYKDFSATTDDEVKNFLNPFYQEIPKEHS
ncbi:MAG: phosphoribosyltransferase [Alphaproteobacteria bacterium]|nr:phosphoribosyltransferase [Alphaproteobacteria bacterium]